jgi:exonuclease SbcC
VGEVEGHISGTKAMLAALPPVVGDVADYPATPDESFEVYDIPRLEARVEWYREAVRAWQAEVGELGRLEKAEFALTAFESLPEQTCPTCGQTVAGDSRKRTIQRYAQAVTDATATLDAAQEALTAHAIAGSPLKCELPVDEDQARRAYIAAMDALGAAKASDARRLEAETHKQQAALADERRKAREAESVAKAASYRERLVGLEGELALAQADHLAAFTASTNAAMALAERGSVPTHTTCALEESRRTLAALAQDRTRIEARLEADSAVRDELIDLDNDVMATATRCDLLAMLVKAYGKGGIPARMIEATVEVIEAFANDFLGRFSDGLTIALTTQRETKTGNTRETLDILVSDSAGTRPIERFSGGERTRVNFAIAVGLSRFLSSLGDGAVDSFSVDEPEYLDPAGVAELVKCLLILAQSVPCVLLVSHIAGVADSLPQRIAVTKGAGGSKVAVST